MIFSANEHVNIKTSDGGVGVLFCKKLFEQIELFD